MYNDNVVILLVGPSGSGKSTVAEALNNELHCGIVQSCTTRPPRYQNETGHEFLSDAEFDVLRPEMVAYTEFDGNRYGVTKAALETNGIYVIDPNGVEYLKTHYDGNKTLKVFYLATTVEICRKRMFARGDDDAKVKDRLENDKKFYSYLNTPTQLPQKGEINVSFLNAEEISQMIISELKRN